LLVFGYQRAAVKLYLLVAIGATQAAGCARVQSREAGPTPKASQQPASTLDRPPPLLQAGPAVSPSSSAYPPVTTPRTANFTRRQRGGDSVTLEVVNRSPAVQHVFIDFEPVGVVAPGSTKQIEVAAGTHTVTCADSADPDHNPVSVTELFQKGYVHTYQLLTR
jgi:hypothetical protein